MVENSDKNSTGVPLEKWNGKPCQHSCLENPMGITVEICDPFPNSFICSFTLQDFVECYYMPNCALGAGDMDQFQ